MSEAEDECIRAYDEDLKLIRREKRQRIGMQLFAALCTSYGASSAELLALIPKKNDDRPAGSAFS